MKEKKNFTLKHFISTPIEVYFNKSPTYTKRPPCPSGFNWQKKQYIITKCHSEWRDFTRKGRMSQNMQPQHAEVASQRGSWGVGKFFFDVQTSEGKFFRLYYDRSPKDALDRSGTWILLAELSFEKD
jgi:hypothetical protein